MKDSDIASYTSRFGDLDILCPGMVPTESKKVERYIQGLSPRIQGNVIVANPLTFDGAKRLAQTLVDHGVRQGSMPSISENTKKEATKRISGTNEIGKRHKSPQGNNKQ